jgi:hypothetical protein
MQKTIKMVSKADRSDAYTYSDANRETVTSIGKILHTSETTLAKAIRSLDESGMAWTFTISPASKSGESTSTPEQFNMFKGDVLSSFPKREQELVLAPIQSLDDAQKKARRTVIMKVGRYVNRITSELKKLQVPQAEQGSKTGAKQSTKQSPLVTHREQSTHCYRISRTILMTIQSIAPNTRHCSINAKLYLARSNNNGVPPARGAFFYHGSII